MLALTARINERDDTIVQLQEELDAIERINKRHEYSIFKLKKMLRERGTTFMHNALGVLNEELDQDLDEEWYSQNDNRFNYPVSISPECIFGEEQNPETMKLVTGDEIIEELQGIINVSNKITKKHTPEDKENLNDYVKIKHLENRLTEVVKENETLIDELQDKKFEVYKLRNKIDNKKEIFDAVESWLEDKIWEMLKKIGISKKNITVMQSLISETMEDFKYKISSDNESEGEKYHPALKKSESYQL